MTDESRFLSFQGIRVHFRVCAPEDPPKERVLLLSSPLIGTFHWRKVVPELVQSACLVALVDMPAFGHSDCSMNVPQDVETRASILWGILDDIDRATDAPSSTWHLMAHGSACGTILEMGGMYPDSVKSQVHITPLLTIPDLLGGAQPDEWYRENILDAGGFRNLIEDYTAYPMDAYILDRMRMPLTRPGARQNFLHMLRAGKKAPEYDLGFCPAMTILGGRDVLTDDAAMEEIRKYLGTAETHTLRSAGHFPMETHSKALRDYLRGWIRFNS